MVSNAFVFDIVFGKSNTIIIILIHVWLSNNIANDRINLNFVDPFWNDSTTNLIILQVYYI